MLDPGQAHVGRQLAIAGSAAIPETEVQGTGGQGRAHEAVGCARIITSQGEPTAGYGGVAMIFECPMLCDGAQAGHSWWEPWLVLPGCIRNLDEEAKG